MSKKARPIRMGDSLWRYPLIPIVIVTDDDNVDDTRLYLPPGVGCGVMDLSDDRLRHVEWGMVEVREFWQVGDGDIFFTLFEREDKPNHWEHRAFVKVGQERAIEIVSGLVWAIPDSWAGATV